MNKEKIKYKIRKWMSESRYDDTIFLAEIINYPKYLSSIFRDEALSIEKTNIAISLRLMIVANKADPSGPFIKKKLNEYRKKEKIKKQSLIKESLLKGGIHLNKYFGNKNNTYFSNKDLWPQFDKLKVDILDKYLNFDDADEFYLYLSVLSVLSEEKELNEINLINDKEVRKSKYLELLSSLLYKSSKFETNLSSSISKYTEMNDDLLRSNLNEFSISSNTLMDFPIDKSIYHVKINHGYWEHLRSTYSVSENSQKGIHVFNDDKKDRMVKYSGITQFLGELIYDYSLSFDKQKGNTIHFGVGLGNGVRGLAEDINNDLTSRTRTASMGLLSMFDAINISKETFLYNADIKKTLITESKIEIFKEKYIDDTEACLFIIPSKLHKIEFNEYDGKVYKFIIPSLLVHETFKVLLSTLLGYIDKLSKKHKSIVIIGQGGIFISLLSLFLSNMDKLGEDTKLRVFDFGLILNMISPLYSKTSPWSRDIDAKSRAKFYNIFKINEESIFSLISKIED